MASDESCTSGVTGYFHFDAREQNTLPNTEKQISNWVVGLVVQHLRLSDSFFGGSCITVDIG